MLRKNESDLIFGHTNSSVSITFATIRFVNFTLDPLQSNKTSQNVPETCRLTPNFNKANKIETFLHTSSFHESLQRKPVKMNLWKLVEQKRIAKWMLFLNLFVIGFNLFPINYALISKPSLIAYFVSKRRTFSCLLAFFTKGSSTIIWAAKNDLRTLQSLLWWNSR